ncbi:uncharacterized protein TRUGW13939_02577 [Talaromyces rugulosus]|uniref:Citrate exporter 1 n=1 Tax=Talaromyces rugulosus TaxID=121627 RepID=A0A7H8QNH3_TALRU|nr:uncharacterized protein TRUGW13939_02577 [Talaromyces rugulosus]QKX55484.1 hypothetical protein TRUGW13939_02577 [Talaromyces rugulosus]
MTAGSQSPPEATGPQAKKGEETQIQSSQQPKNDGPPAPPAYTAIPTYRRTFILSIVTVAGFFGPLAGNIYLPALLVLENEFHVSSTVINATVSVFMVVFAFGPLFWASFADRRGRRPLYIASIAVYILANVLLAALPSNLGALFFLRILQAFGSSAVVSMGAGTVADITEPKRRARAMSYFLLGPQCGPILGPIIGGALAGGASWRWIFGFLAISGFALWVIIVFYLPETLRARVGNGQIYQEASWILWPPRFVSEAVPVEKRGPPPPKVTLSTYWRLFRYPPIGISSFNTAILYSSYFCIAVQLPTALEDTYHWTTAEVGVGYVVVGVAMVIGSLIGGRFSDWRRARLVSSAGEKNVGPESRLVDQIWGVFLCVAGLVMFGWFVDKSIHPAAVLISTFLTGFGMSWIFVATNAFLTECVAQQAAGAFALGNMLRSPAAAVAAVVVSPLVKHMGWGWCFTGLALLNFFVVGTAVLTLRTQSPRWRRERAEKIAK